MLSFIQNGGQEKVRFFQEKTASCPESSLPLEQVELLSPIPVPAQDIVCLGINFWAHAEESARYKKEVFDRNRTDAIYFSKRVNRAVPNGGTIDGHFDLVDSLDYEAELAVILGKDAKNVRRKTRLITFLVIPSLMISAPGIYNLRTSSGTSAKVWTILRPWGHGL